MDLVGERKLEVAQLWREENKFSLRHWFELPLRYHNRNIKQTLRYVVLEFQRGAGAGIRNMKVIYIQVLEEAVGPLPRKIV